ncbi:MAG: hydrogenase expression/formation protein HypE [Dehalococcoidia bacterium]|nr:hydrogenase expression/formation protein HypE [Dehalococcoidia bacterium]
MSQTIVLAHGSGGRMSRDLVTKSIMPFISNALLDRLDDSAVFELQGRLAFTTDSYVVNPIFFPGGDIGRLAVCGTVNDLAVVGAIPKYLSLALIIEEGLPLSDLKKVMGSIREAAEEAGVTVVTGDTKVVNHGGADKLFITTSGIGIIPEGIDISGSNAKPGDKVIISGTIGDHGITIISQREGLKFDAPVKSDCAPLNNMVKTMLKASSHIHAMRDPTRGGLATSLNEIAQQSKVGIRLNEEAIPVLEAVRAVCELLGFDPLYVANEGKLVAFVPADDADRVLAVMKEDRYGKDAAIIGEVVAEHSGRVTMRTRLGTTRIVDMLTGELLPRIC